MESAPTEFGIRVTASTRQNMDLELDNAVAMVRERAVGDGRKGILVTRYAPDSFTVVLSDEVPYGLTQERDLRNRAGQR